MSKPGAGFPSGIKNWSFEWAVTGSKVVEINDTNSRYLLKAFAFTKLDLLHEKKSS